MTADGYHTPVEEYLEAIYSLGEEGTTVIAARVVERMERTAASVSEMLDRLQADGFVQRDGRTITLTEEGRILATSVVRRHRLAERLLVDVIGLEWHKAHTEACRWEHVISPDVEARLVDLLGDPSTCPHGNPIPGSASKVPPVGMALDTVTTHGTFTVVRIAESLESHPAAMASLGAASAIPGASVEVSVLGSNRWSLAGPSGELDCDLDLATQVFVVAS